MNRPRAADDFAAIRARMVELRRERERAEAAEGESRHLAVSPLHPELSRRRGTAGQTSDFVILREPQTRRWWMRTTPSSMPQSSRRWAVGGRVDLDLLRRRT